MRVELIDYTSDALDLLLRTKNTRLKFNDDPKDWPEEKKKEHLDYMRDTIKSSWEFVSYTFKISGVTRAFTHQFVRTRTGAYAQQSQRTVDVRDDGVVQPESMTEAQHNLWTAITSKLLAGYGELIDSGMPVQDARGVLPTNMETEIIARFNLRTLHDMSLLRLCTRTQGEYQKVFRLMRDEVIKVHRWTEDFLQVHCVQIGTCAFPRYGKAECKFYDPRMDLSAVKEETRQIFWASEIQEANPKAKQGRTM